MTTDDLEIAYADHGDPGAPVVLLLHGWPDDASTWDEVVPALTAAGLRAIVPSLRGFGATRFRNRTAPRTGDSAILALDAILAGKLLLLAVRGVAVEFLTGGAVTRETIAPFGPIAPFRPVIPFRPITPFGPIGSLETLLSVASVLAVEAACHI